MSIMKRVLIAIGAGVILTVLLTLIGRGNPHATLGWVKSHQRASKDAAKPLTLQLLWYKSIPPDYLPGKGEG